MGKRGGKHRTSNIEVEDFEEVASSFFPNDYCLLANDLFIVAGTSCPRPSLEHLAPSFEQSRNLPILF